MAEKHTTSEVSKTLLQILAVLGVAVIWGMILHKGYVDISLLADKHSGGDFWRALGQYLLGNLAGGKSPDSIKP